MYTTILPIQLSPNFWLNEFVDSETALANGIDNTPTAEAMANLHELVWKLEAVRGYLGGKPVIISSGYRCPALNAAVRGVANSDHLYGMAADLKVPGFGSPREVAAALAPVIDNLELGQVINEYGMWCHVSIKRPENDINRVLTIDEFGTRAGILKVRTA